MLSLILSGFITSTESASTQWRDDLKGRERYKAAPPLRYSPCSICDGGSCGGETREGEGFSRPNILTQTHSEGQLRCTGSQVWMSRLVAFPQEKRDISASRLVPTMLKNLVPW